uniref:Uncharacterized protein n=1 Tax=Physcomitrium patens TaxID=3218 RepID=A0A7I4EFQ3_PHYPA
MHLSTMAQEEKCTVPSNANSGAADAAPAPRDVTKIKRPQKSLASFVAGGGAGMLSTTLLQPLDVIKTHMQAAENPRDRHFKVVVNRILGEDGVKGLWRGTGPACVRVGLGAGLYFAVLGPMMETIRSAFARGEPYTQGDGGPLKEKLPALVTLSAGALTRSIASSVVCPITVIKTRMEYAAASGLVYRNTFHAVQTISYKEGLSGLYSGLIPTLARDAPYSGLYLLMYNRIGSSLKESVPTGTPQAATNFLAGALAGGSATLLTHPPDVVHGLKGLFVGVMPRVGRRALQQAFAWTIYEEIVQRVSRKF